MMRCIACGWCVQIEGILTARSCCIAPKYLNGWPTQETDPEPHGSHLCYHWEAHTNGEANHVEANKIWNCAKYLSTTPTKDTGKCALEEVGCKGLTNASRKHRLVKSLFMYRCTQLGQMGDLWWRAMVNEFSGEQRVNEVSRGKGLARSAEDKGLVRSLESKGLMRSFENKELMRSLESKG